MKPHKDMTGQKFNNLTLIKYSGRDGQNKHWYLCRCVCGKTVKRESHHLRCGEAYSCGCIKRPRGEFRELRRNRRVLVPFSHVAESVIDKFLTKYPPPGMGAA